MTVIVFIITLPLQGAAWLMGAVSYWLAKQWKLAYRSSEILDEETKP
jgi:uncharacterized membrane protein YccF (DUF307 family)